MRSGDRVMIRSGCWSGHEGIVSHVRPSLSGGDRLVIDVRLTVPLLIAEPNGQKREVELPYAPAELEVLS